MLLGDPRADTSLKHGQRHAPTVQHQVVETLEVKTGMALRLDPQARDYSLASLVGSGLPRIDDVAIDFGLRRAN